MLLELMIPPTKRPGSVVVTRPASHGEVPDSNPGLVVLFSLTDVPDLVCKDVKLISRKGRVIKILNLKKKIFLFDSFNTRTIKKSF